MPTSLFLLGHTHGAATVSWGLSVVLILDPRSPKWHIPLRAQIFFSPSRSPQSLSSRPLARTWLYFPSFTSFSLGPCTTKDSASQWSHIPPHAQWALLPSCWGQSTFFNTIRVHLCPISLTAVRVKTIFHHSLMLVWRSLIARNVVCGPPMEESKGSALILKSKNIVMMKIAVNVSRYLL